MTIGGGNVSYASPPTPKPSTTSRTGQWGKPSNIGTLDRTAGAAWHRPPVSRTDGRQVTTGATGGTATKQKTDGEEARGGERDAHAGKLFVKRHGARAGEYRRGERGDTRAIRGKRST